MAKSSYSGSAMRSPDAPARLLCLDLVERLARVAEGVDAGRHAAIDRHLKQDFLDLVLGEAVLQRTLDMELQLMRPVQRAEHRQIDDAAGSLVHARPGPQRAPAELGRPFGHGAGELISARNRLVDVVLAENLFTDLEALFEQFAFAHGSSFQV